MKLRRINNAADGTLWGYAFKCPGCDESHRIPTVGPQAWSFNGDVDRPTFAPSILAYETTHTGEDGKPHKVPRCHSFVRAGRIEFCSDSGHRLAGATVELPEVAAP